MGAILGVLCIVLAIAAAATGSKPLIFRSGSMEPTISTGSLALSHPVPASEVRVGDVVSVTDAGGNRVTHRVADIPARAGNSATLVLRGDANRDPDTETYTVAGADRVFWDMPLLGYVAAWLATPTAVALLALLVAVILWATFRPDRWSRRRTGGAHRGGHTASSTGWVMPGVLAMAVATATLTLLSSVQSTLAAYTDSATAAATFGAGNLESTPPTMGCSGSGSTVTLTWPASADPSISYAMLVRNSDGSTRTYSSPTENRGSQRVTAGGLNVGGLLIGSGTVVVELHTVQGGQVSKSYSAYRIDYSYLTFLSTNLKCAGAAPSLAAQQVPSTAPSTATEPSVADPSTAPSTTPAPDTPTTTSPAPEPSGEPAPTETATPEADTPLGPATSSGTGYTAQLVRSASSGEVAVVIADSSGTVATLPGTSADKLIWNDGDLWINRSGSYQRVSGSGSNWTSSAVAADDVPAAVTGG
ncbi:hypothetical protein GCM10009624_05280 [Gordonia sinesedis]